LTNSFSLGRASFFNTEDSFYQHEAGLLNEDAFATTLAGVRVLVGFPGYRAAWRAQRREHVGRFGDFMDGLVARARLEPENHIPSVDEWRAVYAAETAST
jgi:hypothetical protein